MSITQPSGSSSPLFLCVSKVGNTVHQKHNCLGFVFIAAIATPANHIFYTPPTQEARLRRESPKPQYRKN
jgi:hypothetical protein